MLAAQSFVDPWRFEANVEVYLLVGFLVGAYVYMVRVIGPRAVPPGTPVVTRRHIGCFVIAMLVLFFASTWPIHQIGEEYLYSVHMVQHMMLSYFLPPLVWLATPEWLLRVLVGRGRLYRVVTFMAKPVVAAVVFNLMVMVLHIPGVVNTAPTSAPLHYLLHLAVVLTALLVWLPVVGPFPELQMGYGAKMIYLFLLSVVPTVPAAWLTFAEDPVYSHYGEQPVRVWGMSPMEDQQLAAMVMKVVAGLYLWTLIVVMFFTRFGRDEPSLTYEAVTDAFDRSEAPTEPPRPSAGSKG